MSIYRVQALRHTHPRLGHEGLAGGINWLISDTAIVEVEQPDSHREYLSLQLRRDEHLQAVNEISEAVQRLGYTLLNIEISELVGQTVEATVFSAAGTGGVVHAKTDNPLLTLLAAIVGGFVANRVAAQLRRYEVVYRFAPSPSGWVLRPTAPA